MLSELLSQLTSNRVDKKPEEYLSLNLSVIGSDQHWSNDVCSQFSLF